MAQRFIAQRFNLATSLALTLTACNYQPPADYPVQYQFSTDRSLSDRAKLWRHSNPRDFKVAAVEHEAFPFKEARISYLHPDMHDRISRIYDEHIDLILIDGSQCGFDLGVENHYVTACEGPAGKFMGMLRTLGRLVDDEFVPVVGWTFEDLTPEF